MSNKKQTAVESIIQKINNVKPTEFCSIETIKKWCIEAKAMEKEQIMDELKLIGNYFDVSKLDAEEIKHHIRFTSIIQDRINHYKETYEHTTK
jgi:hypothetical protein